MAAGSLLGCTVGPLHFVACLACLRTRTLGKCNTDRRSAVLGRAALYRKLDCSRAAAAAADSHGRLPPVGPEVAPPPSLSPALSLSLSLNTLSLALALTLLHTLGALIRPPATLVRCLPSHPAAASSTSAPPALDSDDKSHRSYHRQRIARHPAHLHPPQFASTLPSTVARPCLSKVSRPVVACPFLPPPPPLLLPSQSSPSPGNRCQPRIGSIRNPLRSGVTHASHYRQARRLFVVLRFVHPVIVRSLPRRIPWPGRLHRSTSSCLVATLSLPPPPLPSVCHTSLLLHPHRPRY